MQDVRNSAGIRVRPGLFAVCLSLAAACSWAGSPLPPTANDFKEPGTQPVGSGAPSPTVIVNPINPAQVACYLCHSGFDDPATTVKPWRWRGSMHAHAYRDPIFQAAFVVAQNDAPGSGELCLRCHTPGAWLEGRASPPTGNPDGSDLIAFDTDEGVTCHVCHRLVDLDSTPPGPSDDVLIRNALFEYGLLPTNYGNAKMVVEPMDVRRGPLDFIANEEPEPPHSWAYSPHHRTGDLCGTCHEVSNPLFNRVGGTVPAPTDTYVLNNRDEPHPTQNKYDQFPEQRTYSEWLNSSFAQTPGGLFIPDADNPLINRFGGNRMMVSQCQDCHMPARTGQACWEIFESPVRPDVPEHSFVGANVFAIDLIMHMHGPSGTDELDSETMTLLQRQRLETKEMLEKATDMTLTQTAAELKVRVVNQTGHKLLTGMPEGRRIWKNVRFYSGSDVIDERGAYNNLTGDLVTTNTKVYEQLLGIDSYMSGQTGKPVGPSFHLVLNNKVFKDNRIPPRGFRNAEFNAVQAGHVGYSYADGQYWDDTRYCIPEGADRAVVTLYYQTSSKEYIEFLRDGTSPDPRGPALYAAWEAVGRSEPVVMDHIVIPLVSYAKGDVNNDGRTTFGDITVVLANFGALNVGILGGDANCDGIVSFGDITYILANFGDEA